MEGKSETDRGRQKVSRRDRDRQIGKADEMEGQSEAECRGQKVVLRTVTKGSKKGLVKKPGVYQVTGTAAN